MPSRPPGPRGRARQRLAPRPTPIIPTATAIPTPPPQGVPTEQTSALESAPIPPPTADGWVPPPPPPQQGERGQTEEGREGGAPLPPLDTDALRAKTLTELRAIRSERIRSREAIERMERDRASTPLALALQIVSCHWATEYWDDQHTMPVQFDFPTRKCYLGKVRPDQDCRRCQYCKLIPYGVHLPTHERRYHEAGLVIPIPDEETANALAAYLREQGHQPLRSVQHEIEWLDATIARYEAEEQARGRQRLEAQQRGQMLP